LGTLTKDPVISTPTIQGLIEKITAIINYNKNNAKHLTLYSGKFVGIEGLTLTEKESLIKAVSDKFEKQVKGHQEPTLKLIEYLETLIENPPVL